MASLRPTATFIAAGLGIIACDQMSQPLAPTDDPAANRDPFQLAELGRASSGQSRSPFGCDLSVKTSDDPKWYSHHRLNLGIPERDQASDRSKIRYVLHVGEQGKAPVATAYCVIPNTPKAVAFLDRNIAHQSGTHSRSADIAPSYSSDGYTLITIYIYATSFQWYSAGGYWESDDWDGSSYDTGGGYEYDNPDLIPPMGCYPNTDSLCLTDLKPEDNTLINQALANHLSLFKVVPDSALRDRCQGMAAFFQMAREETNPPVVYRGAYNTTTAEGTQRPHSGMTGPNFVMHIDPWLFDSAATGDPKWLAELANTVLHEAAHLMGKQHPDNEGYKVPIAGVVGPQYTSAWFSDMNFNPEKGRSCIRYPSQ